MGLRFRKSIKLAPGIRMNLSKSGVSWTAGPRGASIGIGRRGTYLNTGIPGTGLYSREKLGSGPSQRPGRSSGKEVKVPITISLDDDGTILYLDEKGNPVDNSLVNTLKRQKGEELRQLIEDKCNEINAQIDALGEIHLYTPSPDNKPVYIPSEYDVPTPAKPKKKGYGILGRLFTSIRLKIDNLNKEWGLEYENQLRQWHKDKTEFEKREESQKYLIEQGIYNNPDLMVLYLEETLQDIVWPRETLISMDIGDDGQCIYIDVDLPEIEDMPTKKASVPKRGYKLTVKDMSETQLRKLYMAHVHGIGFRIIGETFAALPKIDQVVLSSYSQRLDKSTGHVVDEYLYSLKVSRNNWNKLNFKQLEVLDLIEALDQFDMRRKMTKTGIFKPIEPFGQK